jgi:tetratricopeptide (TPR) repeat protein
MNYYVLMLRFNRLLLPVLFSSVLGANAQTASEAAAPPLSSAMGSALFYEILLGELSARSGEPGDGFSLMLNAARKTNDPRLYQRAVDIALQARSGESALQAARAWRQALPASREANQYILQLLIGLNRISETVLPLKREVAVGDIKDRSAVILAIPRYFERSTDKKQAANAVELALADQLSSATHGVAAWTTIGRMRLEAEDANGALDAARRAQALDDKSEGAALLALAVMASKAEPAEAIVNKYLNSAKPLPEVRMAYARTLLDAQRYAQAHVQLQTLNDERPDFPQAWLVRGVLELQDNQAEDAERSLKRYVELAKKTDAVHAQTARGLTQAYISLAQIAEKRQDMAQADTWLQEVDNTQDVLNVKLRRALTLAQQGRLDDARQMIRSQPEKTTEDARLKVSTEVQLLRESKHYKEAYELLAQASSEYPQDVDLQYDQAMVAEKLGNLDEMERLLRQVIQIKPDYQHAYNALGYSLAERNIRLPEARQLIKKALEYAPGDPFISDSLAWVEYRSGNLAQALQILQDAFKAKPDAEIAAHLGEVLWSLGRQDEALSAWKEGKTLNADNETLQETVKRLRAPL